MHYLIIRNFLATADCDKLIEMGRRGAMQQSPGFDLATGQNKQYDDYRTSRQLWLSKGDPYLSVIEARIAEATGTPVENGEQFQLAYYPANCFYKVHYDYFDPRYAGSSVALNRGGQRIITFMIYLNTIPENCGGETSFVSAGVKVRPERGKALVFWNVMPNWELDTSTYHEGLPPAQGYEKWILNRWIREREHI